MGVLTRVWALYARSQEALTVRKVVLSVRDANTQRHLERLNHAGLIQILASKPLAQSKKYLEKEKDASASKQTLKPNTTNGQLEQASTAVDQEMLRLARGWIDDHPPSQ